MFIIKLFSIKLFEPGTWLIWKIPLAPLKPPIKAILLAFVPDNETTGSDEKSELLQVQIFKAYKDLTESYQQIDIANTSLEQSIEYEQEVKNNFDAGISNTSDLLEARAQTQKAKDDQIDVKSQYRIKLANYLLVVGKINTDV